MNTLKDLRTHVSSNAALGADEDSFRRDEMLTQLVGHIKSLDFILNMIITLENYKQVTSMN